MIVKIFKSNQIYVYAFIPLVLVALRWPTLTGPPPFTPSGQLPFLQDFFAWLSDYPWLSLLLGVVTITYQAYLISEIANEHRLLHYSSNLAAFILAISYSVFAPQDWFSPVILANLFSVLALKRITGIVHQGGIHGTLFRVGVYISLASLIYLPSVFMMLILFYDLAIIRTFKWREYAIPVIGLFTPFIYFLIYYYLSAETEIFINYFIEPKTFLSILEFKFINWIPSIITSIIVVMSLGYLISSGQKRTVRENNVFKVIVITFLVSLLLSFVYSKDFMSATALMWPSATLLMSYFLLGLNRKWIQEGLVYILLLSIVFRDIITIMGN